MVDIKMDGERCKGCGLCVRSCPNKIIEISRSRLNARGYHPAEVTDAGRCTACASCARTCPDIVISISRD